VVLSSDYGTFGPPLSVTDFTDTHRIHLSSAIRRRIGTFGHRWR